MFPSVLYQPTEYDFKTGANARRLLFSNTSSFAGTSAALDGPTTPANVVQWITHVMVFWGNQAGAEFAQRVRVGVLGPNLSVYQGYVLNRFDGASAAGLGVAGYYAEQVNLMLMPDQFLQFVVNKNAAVNTFEFGMSLWGFYLPRANIQSG